MSALVQGTEQWLEERRSKVGASDAPIIMEVSPWKTPYELWEEKLGLRKPPEMTSSMSRGLEMENKAISKFEEITGIMTTKRVIYHPKNNWMMASLDGMDFDEKHIVEIKCPNNKDHREAKDGKVPEKYIPQLQHQLAVSGLEMAFYFSFDGEDGVIVEVRRDDKYIGELIGKEEKFYSCMKSFTPPEMSLRDFKQVQDPAFELYETRYLSLEMTLKKLEKEKEEIKAHLINMAGDSNAIGRHLRLQKVVRKGSIDYKAIPELQTIDMEKYRTAPSTFWRISNEKA